jgi:hypothetical protein
MGSGYYLSSLYFGLVPRPLVVMRLRQTDFSSRTTSSVREAHVLEMKNNCGI